MAAFILLYCYLFAVWGFSNKIHDFNKKRKIQCVASAIGLIFLLGLHSPEVGNDVCSAYAPAFENSYTEFSLLPDSYYGFEVGFVNYMALIHKITNDVQVYLFLSSLIIVIPIIILIYKKSEAPMFSIFIYTSWFLYYFSFSGLRQAIAISLCVIATLFMLKKKLLPFVLMVILASQIHTSALLFIITYPLYWYRLSNTKTIGIGIVIIGILIFSPNLMQVVAAVLFGSDSKYSERLSTFEFSGFTMAIVYLGFAMFQTLYDKKNKNSYIPILIFITIIQFTGIYSPVISRLAYYYLPLFSLSFPYVIENMQSRNKNIVRNTLIALFISFFFFQASSQYLKVVPFRFFWE